MVEFKRHKEGLGCGHENIGAKQSTRRQNMAANAPEERGIGKK